MQRTGIPEDIRYYFPDNEPIWYIGESLSDRKELNDGLNRESIKIDDLNQLIQNVEMSAVNNEPYASVVIMPEIPINLKTNLTMLKTALDAMKKVKVYEINRDPLFEYGQSVPSLYKLKEYSFEKTRSENIKTYVDPTDRQAELMRSLEIDLGIARNKEKELNEIIENCKKEIADLNSVITELTADIDEKYMYKINTLSKKNEELEDTLSNIQIDLSTERNKTTEYAKDLSAKTEELSSLKYTIQALEKKIEEQKNKQGILKSEKLKLLETIDKLEVIQRRLKSTTVDEETFIILSKEIQEKDIEITRLESIINDLNVTIKTKDFEIKSLQTTINNLRNGESDIMSSGRTYALDNATLKTTTLLYIKVIEEIPYMKQYIDVFHNALESYLNQKGLLVILKNDDGMDNVLFKGLNVLANFNDIQKGKNKYRMYPSTTMFNGLKNLEENFDFIIFVDYMENTNYYLRSDVTEKFMNTVNHSKKIRQYGLKGNAISLDSDSIVDIKYNQTIANMAMKENRDTKVLFNVSDWIKNLNLE